MLFITQSLKRLCYTVTNMKRGFTIVELLVVIVVIAILAAIVTVAYSGVTASAEKGAIQSDLRSEATKLGLYKAENDSYPETLTSQVSIGSSTTSFTYSKIDAMSFCLTAVSTRVSSLVFHITQDGTIVSGYCAGHEPVAATAGTCFAFDAATGTITNYYDNEDNNSSHASCPRDVVIPDKIGGVAVTKVGDASFVAKSLHSVVIPSSVTTVGQMAFLRSGLSSAVIPSSVQSIGVMAFFSNNLTNLTLPSSNLQIGEGAFSGGNQLPDSQAFIYARTSSGIDTSKLVAYAGLKKVGVVIPSSVATIGSRAFQETGLNSITIPSSVTSIESLAFYTNGLTSITIPSSVTLIGDSAFESNNIPSVVIPSSVTAISGRLFRGNPLASITIPSSVTSIGSYAFNLTSLSSVTIPSSVTTIGEHAFEGSSLSSLTIPSSVTSIGDGAFNSNQLPDGQAFIYGRNTSGQNTSTLVSYGGAKKSGVVIPSSVTTIGPWAFYYTWVTSVTIPSSVTTIASRAFYAGNLSSIAIPSSVTSIGDYAFYSNQITSVSIPVATTLGWQSFDGSTTVTRY